MDNPGFRRVFPAEHTPRWPLLVPLILALALRLLLWDRLPRTGLISDEGEYLSAASWLAQGRGFAWYIGYLWTRAPLYPLFLAAQLRLSGGDLTPIYITQTLLSLLNVVLVYRLAGHASADAAPAMRRRLQCGAATLMALYFPLATYTQVLLSETLFITLLLASLLCLSADQRAPRRAAALAGACLGLATLTRSLTLAFIPLLAVWLLIAQHRQGARGWTAAGPALALLLSAGLLIAPWTLYNSRAYGGTVIIDTSGAFNLLLGTKTAAEGGRNDASTRDYVLGLFPGANSAPTNTCQPHPGPLPSQAARQSAMTSEALCLIARQPLAFAGKSLAELADLFRVNYTGAERFANGFTTGRLPPAYALGLFLLDDTLYVLVLPLTVLGWVLAPPSRLRQLAGLWWAYNIAVAPLLFAINRFRLPLLPLAFIFAAYGLLALPSSLPRLRSRAGLLGVGLAGLLFLLAASPHAYLEPRPAGSDATWSSYLGPYPSSLANTGLALMARPRYLATEQLREALQTGNASAAAAALRSAALDQPTRLIGTALLAGLTGQPADGLAALGPYASIAAARQVERAIVYGDLLRSQGQPQAARAALGGSAQSGFIDDANPVGWAWAWLHPAPTRTIDLAGDLDLGYIAGCYLGEGDTDPAAAGTWRWCSDGAQLRFPAAGTGAPQTLALRLDGRGWPADMRPAPPLELFSDGQLAGSCQPDPQTARECLVALPAAPAGSDRIITLRTATFVPDAARYLSQQGSQVGQVQRLGARLDWAELR